MDVGYKSLKHDLLQDNILVFMPSKIAIDFNYYNQRYNRDSNQY
jgi:hypothetical protein